jgi:N-acetylneuraminic acid mutarotase
MPAGRERAAGGVVSWNGTIYYFGGLRQRVSLPWVDAYDVARDTWTSLPDMPHARDHLEAAAVNGSVYVIGGRLGDPNVNVAATDRYDVAQGTWTTGLAPLPDARAGSGIVQTGNELWVLGGWNQSGAQHEVDAYDIGTDTWRGLAPMPTARDGLQALVWQGNVYVAGGGTMPKGTGPTNVLEVYVPDSTVRPDALVRPANGGAALGDDVYNLTGLSQSTAATAARGVSKTFQIRVANDGSTPDSFTVRGSPAGSSAFIVTYLKGATGNVNVTSAVVAGTYTTPVLAPGATAVLRLRVQVKAGAAAKAVQATSISVASTTRPTSKDVVKATVTVKV